MLECPRHSGEYIDPFVQGEVCPQCVSDSATDECAPGSFSCARETCGHCSEDHDTSGLVQPACLDCDCPELLTEDVTDAVVEEGENRNA